GPGAAYAAADEHGVVTNYTDDAAAADCRLDLVDLGAIGIRSWLFDPIPNYSYTVPAHFDREDRVAEADRRLGVRLQELEENAEEGAADPGPAAMKARSCGSPELSPTPATVRDCRSCAPSSPSARASSPVPCPRRRPAPRGCCS